MTRTNCIAVLGIMLCWLMTSCASQSTSGVLAGKPDQAPSVVSSTPIPSLTSAVSPTSPVSTKTFIPTATFPVTPTPSHLNNQGPWIVIKAKNSEDPWPAYFVTDLDGTGWTTLNTPHGKNQVGGWEVIPSPKGGFIAFAANQVPMDQIPERYELDQTGISLNIVKLPENETVRTIPLLNDKAVEQIELEMESGIFPPQLMVLTNNNIIRWSPDGRYLAYAAAVESVYPDVYLYDAANDTTERITYEEFGAIPWEWSPDGRWLLYHQITNNDYELMTNLPEFKAVYAYSSGTKPIFLYPAQWKENIKWITNEKFLAYTFYECHDCGDNLREVNLENGSVRQLYKGEIIGPFYDPSNQAILLNFSPNSYLSFDIEPGLYRLDLDTLALKMFLPGHFETAYWSKELKKFIVYARSENDVENLVPIVYDENDMELFRLPETKYYPPQFQAFQPSPDGNWFYVEDHEKISLYDSHGKFIKNLERGNLFWLKDSSGLVQITSTNGSIYLYEHKTNWEPHLIQSFNEKNTYLNAFFIYP